MKINRKNLQKCNIIKERERRDQNSVNPDSRYEISGIKLASRH